MKELYTSPELKVLCFAPVERLAAGDSIDFGALKDLVGGSTSLDSGEIKQSGDFSFEI